ncbi:MAG: PHP domain-containing protein [Povalibacter sp.]
MTTVAVAAVAMDQTAFPATTSRFVSLAVACTLAVLIAALFPISPVRDAVSLQAVSGVHLDRPLAYIVFAPLSNLLDAITLLSASQHVAAFFGVLGIWAFWRLARRRVGQAHRGAHFVSLAILLSAIVTLYAAAMFLPRPMAFLTSADPDTLRIDFHSHTNASRDASQSFTAEENRSWHQAGGYDVAFVTNHGVVVEIEPRRAGVAPGGLTSTILLPGIEANWLWEHVGLLGTESACRAMLSSDYRDLVPASLAMHVAGPPDGPLVIWNHPRASELEKVASLGRLPLAGVHAIELSNGAPHAMDMVRRKREAIVAFAKDHDLALTSGTDNHGWGHAAPNWTLLRLKHWRALSPAELGSRIEREITESGFGVTQVVERTTVDPGMSEVALALTVLTVPWRMLTTLSAYERMMWILWIWVLPVLARLIRAATNVGGFVGTPTALSDS